MGEAGGSSAGGNARAVTVLAVRLKRRRGAVGLAGLPYNLLYKLLCKWPYKLPLNLPYK